MFIIFLLSLLVLVNISRERARKKKEEEERIMEREREKVFLSFFIPYLRIACYIKYRYINTYACVDM